MWICGRARAHGRHDVDVVVAVEFGVDATLQADFRRPLRLGFSDALADLVQGQKIGIAPQVERKRTLREGTEPTLERADVRVVDVAVDDEGDVVADEVTAQRYRPRRLPR